jgi:signal transduction histidine kinase
VIVTFDALELAVRALAFFNTIALSWLGLTVLLNADRRKLGTWLTGGGLLLGGLCSIGHGIVAGRADWGTVESAVAWWRLSWLPFAGAAYLWSVVVVWYSGRLRGRWECLGVTVLSLAGLVVFVMLLSLVGLLDTLVRPRVAIGIYALFASASIIAALAALYRPVQPDRFMGELAARRARPWLTVTSLVALALSGAVSLALLGPSVAAPRTVDLVGLALVALQVVLMGRAIVSYEVFTGKPLPRGGLARHWRRSLVLAGGLGGLMALSLELSIDETLRLLLALLIVTAFYALMTWRLLAERERSLERLRPFVASRQLSASLLDPVGAGGERGLAARSAALVGPFRALCDELLGAEVGILCGVGPLAPLIGPPLAHPAAEVSLPDANLAELTEQFAGQAEASGRPCLALDPASFSGASWAVPLWNGPSLGGLLLLGEKRDGSLYTEEEIEIARVTGERLIDAQATAELARRLLIVQRRRMAEEQIRDRTARRVLHDDVLPLLHSALLAVGNGHANGNANGRSAATTASTALAPTSPAGSAVAAASATEVVPLLADAHHRVADLLRELPSVPARATASAGLAGALRAAVSELARSFDSITWHLPTENGQADLALSPLATEVVFGAVREAVRNADRHGRGADPGRALHLSVALFAGDEVMIWIEDTGVGVDASQATSGSGQGLVLHGTLLALLGGALVAERVPRGGTRVVIRIPASA